MLSQHQLDAIDTAAMAIETLFKILPLSTAATILGDTVGVFLSEHTDESVAHFKSAFSAHVDASSDGS